MCRIRPVFTAIVLTLGLVTRLHAESPTATKPSPRQESGEGIRHSLLITGSTGTWLYDEASNLVWETPGASHDGYVLDNGNVLVSVDNVAREFKQGTQEVVWSYTLDPVNVELGTVVRLDGGNTMVVERGIRPRILELTPEGKVAVEVPLQPETDNNHMQTRMARKLPNGNYLVPHLFAYQVKEYTPEGKVVRSIPTDLPEFGGRKEDSWPFTAILLPNGNVHVNLTHGNRVAEFAPDNSVVWSLDNTQVDGRLSDPCGAQRLPNGNAVICSYGQRDAEKPRIFEVTRDKKVVWEFYHPSAHAHEVHIITTNGEKVSPVMR